MVVEAASVAAARWEPVVRWFLFLVVAAISWTARAVGFSVQADPAASALLSASCLIIGGVLAGELAAGWRLPRVTGYLVLGLVAGPYALGIATDAIDRLHSTAHSHHRIIVCEIMGHRAGWLALGAGIAGGADVILIPEIPYDVESVAEAIRKRSKSGKNFSIVAVAEGAMSREHAAAFHSAEARKLHPGEKGDKKKAKAALAELEAAHQGHTLKLSGELEQLTNLESRVTILGHLQRGGTPSAADRLLATRLGSACAELIHQGTYGVMVASRGDAAVPVPLDQVDGQRNLIPPDHPWITAARRVGTNLGD